MHVDESGHRLLSGLQAEDDRLKPRISDETLLNIATQGNKYRVSLFAAIASWVRHPRPQVGFGGEGDRAAMSFVRLFCDRGFPATHWCTAVLQPDNDRKLPHSIKPYATAGAQRSDL